MTRQKEQEDKAEKITEEIGKRNQMTALRFQTREGHQTSPASLRGRAKGETAEGKTVEGGKAERGRGRKKKHKEEEEEEEEEKE